MGDNIFDKKELADLSYKVDITSGVHEKIEELSKRAHPIAQEAYENRKKMKDALEQTAINTAETNTRLQKVVENQNAYIDLLKEQLTTQQQQLENNEKQLTILKNIFASGEDGVAVEKEIMKLIKSQIDSNHPLWDYVKDKGGDIAVTGLIYGSPIIYGAIKTYLATKGLILP
ncbi:hypothetical protein JYG23_04315 [Sedimentibacter sp. zth1]|uniref:hypothetical protein n=1 Tax=Sedimentibacter sp. zth1 TaxID=2816908 RepID=UPI001A910779|nr:hypothetical protein [Sedimentibacter sp. zth1]QSX06686.1 hypothetical protein JYG23_04315 [Sedimentibacter sp. zth1]